MTTFINKTKNWLRSGTGIRTVIWIFLCLGLSLILFRDFWFSLPRMLSPDWVFGNNHASSWGVLALCLAFLWIKRQQLYTGITRNKKFKTTNVKTALTFYILNIETLLVALLITSALFIPSTNDLAMLRVLLLWLAIFIFVFGIEASKIPAILLTLYAFVILFPLAIYRFAEEPYTMIALVPLTALLDLLGYPLQSNGQILHLISSNGETISVLVSGACAGPTTMAVFIALFVLMMLDVPLPPRKAIWLFLAGIVGTWFQSFIRLFILMLTAYYLGREAMWTAHSWSIYILFPLWYLIFAYIYFRQVGRVRRTAKTSSGTPQSG